MYYPAPLEEQGNFFCNRLARYERYNYSCMWYMQASKLYDDKKQEKYSE